MAKRFKKPAKKSIKRSKTSRGKRSRRRRRRKGVKKRSKPGVMHVRNMKGKVKQLSAKFYSLKPGVKASSDMLHS